jgi:hypothetical protein
MRLMAIVMLLAGALAAAGITGTWRGTVATEMAHQTTGGQISAYMAK